MKNHLSSIVLGIGVVVVVGLFVRGGVMTYKPSDPLNNKGFWSAQLSHNAEEAYQLFKKNNAEVPLGLQHSTAHLFGGLLYEIEGVSGITLCDASFSFGCFHGFFTRAIAEEGVALVPELDKACLARYGEWGTGCQHGIGHGIMEYFGFADIATALEACELTTWPTPLAGCPSGVFMEYRIPAVLRDGLFSTEPRMVDNKNPYEPCGEVDARYHDSCYYELGLWWRMALGPEYARMGSWCSDLHNEKNRMNCFLGVGSAAAQTETFDVPRTLSRCEEAAPEGRPHAFCVAGSSWSFYAEPSFRTIAPQLCDAVEPALQPLCRQHADITQGKGGVSL